MKKIVLLLLLVPALTQAYITETLLNKSIPATNESIDKAIKLLEQVKTASEENRPKLLKSAQELLKSTSEEVKFSAAFYMGSYRLWSVDIDYDEEYDDYYWPNEMCYVGNSEEALKLAKYALEKEYWVVQDEYGLSKLRIEEGKVLVSVDDLPNDVSESYEITPCGDSMSFDIELLLDAGCGLVHNGNCDSEEKVNLDTFNAKEFVESKVGEDDNYSDFSTGLDDAIYNIDNMVDDPKLKEVLEKLKASGSLINGVSTFPNDTCDDAESCNWLDVYLIMKDGTVVYFNFD